MGGRDIGGGGGRVDVLPQTSIILINTGRLKIVYTRRKLSHEANRWKDFNI